MDPLDEKELCGPSLFHIIIGRRTMKISLGRLFLWVLCISFQMTTLAFAAESEFSRNISIAEDSEKELRERIVAIHYLGVSGEKRALKPMLGILMDEKEKEGIRCVAVRGLVDLGQERFQIISSFEEAYRARNTEENLRYTILLSLGRMRAEESLPLFSDALSDPSGMIRFKASQAIGLIGTDKSASLLIYHLNEEQDRMVRAEMVRAMGGVTGPESRKALIHSLLSDPSPLVRWNAALTLKKFEPLSLDARSSMASALNDDSPMVRKTVKGILQ